jgi:hypothetical protein
MYGPWSPPAGYHLDESDPDIPVLRHGDGTFVAAFSAPGAIQETILQAAENDRRTYGNRRSA